MRKEQAKIIEKARKKALDNRYIEVLEKEDLTIKQLKLIYDYIVGNKKYGEDKILNEIDKYIFYDCDDHTKENILLPYRDKLIGEDEKKKLIVENQKKYYVNTIYIFLCNHTEEEFIDLKNFIEKNELNELLTNLKNYNSSDINDLITNYTDSYYYMYSESNVSDSTKRGFNILKKMLQNGLLKITDTKDTRKTIVARLQEEIEAGGVGHDNELCYYLLPKEKYNCLKSFVDGLIEYVKNKAAVVLDADTCYTSGLFYSEDIRRFINDLKEHGNKYRVTIACPVTRIAIRREEQYTNVYIYTYREIQIDKTVNAYMASDGVSFAIYPDETILERKSEKWYPLTIKNFLRISLKTASNVYMDIVELFLNCCSQCGYTFAKDIKTDLANGCSVPITFNDLFVYHNRKEYMISKYKRATKYNIKWNKLNLNLSYMILKSMSYVDKRSSTVLINHTFEKSLDGYMYSPRGKVREGVSNFLKAVISSKINMAAEVRMVMDEMYKDSSIVLEREELEEEQNAQMKDAEQMLDDYIAMCFQTKMKVDLRITTLAQLKNRHDRVNYEDNYENAGPVCVPKNSRFNHLRKLLPKEYEWIRDRKRLIDESRIQHHCVWSYAGKITSDKCAIYSYYDKDGKYGTVPKRYTLEFLIDESGKYYIYQAQGRYDSVNSSSIYNYIENLLNEIQK